MSLPSPELQPSLLIVAFALARAGIGLAARVRGGELGSVPALVGLDVITVVFAVVHQGFLSAYNVEALVIQAARIIVMAMGLVFVLLFGEIDLAAGTTGGLCPAIPAVLILRAGASWWLVLVVGLVAGLLIGFGMAGCGPEPASRRSSSRSRRSWRSRASR